MTEYQHRTVLLEESLDLLDLKSGGLYLDATLGDGGHTQAMLEHGVKVVAIDQDPEAITRAEARLKAAFSNKKIVVANTDKITDLDGVDCLLVRTNFANIADVFQFKFDGILFDLGVSTVQILKPERGFTFQSEGPLDMRMDPDLAVTAADLLRALSQKELTRLISELGDEPYAALIAKKIVKARQLTPFTTTTQLAELIARLKPTGKIHPATKTFQALRMAVNQERDSLRTALPAAIELLKKGGRIAVISFHSGEDRIVKHFFKDQEQSGVLQILTSKPIEPTELEINNNIRSRSAKIRAAKKI